jgi:hypothetical protein
MDGFVVWFSEIQNPHSPAWAAVKMLWNAE